MQRIKFNKALNKETRFYNVQVGGLVGLIILGLFSMIVKGIIFGFAGGGIGFLIGSFIYKRWHSGVIQRYLYRRCGLVLGANQVPPSYMRKLM